MHDIDLLPTRFVDKIDSSRDDCWTWTACTGPAGYGQVAWNRVCRDAHRLIYEMLVGPVPNGLELDHLCRNRACVNPGHLEPVTRAENQRRGIRASMTHCMHGHEFSPENTYLRPRGGRQCRKCGADAARRYTVRKKAVA